MKKANKTKGNSNSTVLYTKCVFNLKTQMFNLKTQMYNLKTQQDRYVTDFYCVYISSSSPKPKEGFVDWSPFSVFLKLAWLPKSEKLLLEA